VLVLRSFVEHECDPS